MTKEQLIKEFREKFTAKHEYDNLLFVDLRGSSVDALEAFLLSAFDAGRASGIEEVKYNKMPCENHTIYSESCVACQKSNELTPSSSKDN